jgi:phosphoserine aminotransferase
MSGLHSFITVSIMMDPIQNMMIALQGGIDAVFENNKAKAKVVYDAIADSGGFYRSPVDPSVQSLMNVPFTIPSNPDLEKEFVKASSKAGLVRVPQSHTSDA